MVLMEVPKIISFWEDFESEKVYKIGEIFKVVSKEKDESKGKIKITLKKED